MGDAGALRSVMKTGKFMTCHEKRYGRDWVPLAHPDMFLGGGMLLILLRARAIEIHFTVSRRFPPAGFENRANTKSGKASREARIFFRIRANTRFEKASREARIFRFRANSSFGKASREARNFSDLECRL